MSQREREDQLRDELKFLALQLGIEIAAGAVVPLLREIIIPWFRDLLAAGVDPEYAMGVAVETVVGIDDDPDHLTASDVERATLAREAIRLQLAERGGIPSDSDLNRFIELVYRKVQARRGARCGVVVEVG